MHRSGSSAPFFASVRNRFQLVVFAATLAIGLQFYLFVEQVGSGGPVTIQRPAGVEGFLPIGALLAWKQWATTGVWDSFHPAAMVVLLYAAAISLLFRKSFCSWFCPVGTLSEWLWRIGQRLLKNTIQLPRVLDVPLRMVKYLLLAFFVTIVFRMPSADIASFLSSPYYKLADVKMLHFFTRIGTVAAATVAALVLFSVVIKNFWCRYLCPYGALMGLLALIGPSAIHRNPGTCTNCLKCTRICPSHLPVHRTVRLISPECSGCLDCVHICPAAGTLSMKAAVPGNPVWDASRLAVIVGVAFVVLVFTAQATGHWKSGISEAELRMLLRMVDTPMLGHPSF